MTLNEARTAIANRSDFTAGNLRGFWRNSFEYVVMSYSTVIAVYDLVSLCSVMSLKAYDYSQTTSKHANIVKRAWGIN